MLDYILIQGFHCTYFMSINIHFIYLVTIAFVVIDCSEDIGNCSSSPAISISYLPGWGEVDTYMHMCAHILRY